MAGAAADGVVRSRRMRGERYLLALHASCNTATGLQRRGAHGMPVLGSYFWPDAKWHIITPTAWNRTWCHCSAEFPARVTEANMQ